MRTVAEVTTNGSHQVIRAVTTAKTMIARGKEARQIAQITGPMTGIRAATTTTVPHPAAMTGIQSTATVTARMAEVAVVVLMADRTTVVTPTDHPGCVIRRGLYASGIHDVHPGCPCQSERYDGQ